MYTLKKDRQHFLRTKNKRLKWNKIKKMRKPTCFLRNQVPCVLNLKTLFKKMLFYFLYVFLNQVKKQRFQDLNFFHLKKNFKAKCVSFNLNLSLS